MIDNSKEYILCAAVRRLDGTVDYGYRHDQIYSRVPKEQMTEVYGIDFYNDMGFLTSKNRFVGRREAYQIALECGQIKQRVPNEDKEFCQWLGITEEERIRGLEWLASEDLY